MPADVALLFACCISVTACFWTIATAGYIIAASCLSLLRWGGIAALLLFAVPSSRQMLVSIDAAVSKLHKDFLYELLEVQPELF
jgi:hypothetical protein